MTTEALNFKHAIFCFRTRGTSEKSVAASLNKLQEYHLLDARGKLTPRCTSFTVHRKIHEWCDTHEASSKAGQTSDAQVHHSGGGPGVEPPQGGAITAEITCRRIREVLEQNLTQLVVFRTEAIDMAPATAKQHLADAQAGKRICQQALGRCVDREKRILDEGSDTQLSGEEEEGQQEEELWKAHEDSHYLRLLPRPAMQQVSLSPLPFPQRTADLSSLLNTASDTTGQEGSAQLDGVITIPDASAETQTARTTSTRTASTSADSSTLPSSSGPTGSVQQRLSPAPVASAGPHCAPTAPNAKQPASNPIQTSSSAQPGSSKRQRKLVAPPAKTYPKTDPMGGFWGMVGMIRDFLGRQTSKTDVPPPGSVLDRELQREEAKAQAEIARINADRERAQSADALRLQEIKLQREQNRTTRLQMRIKCKELGMPSPTFGDSQ
mmetsp:Transcript_50744/g.103216  ORF Transcript_50744/g.103216 Transcript_50744/m.103216 type:complete len:438 (-) Transcript_50744:197-1510(-)